MKPVTIGLVAASSLSFALEEQEIIKLIQEYYQVKVRNDVTGLNQLRSEDFFATTARGYARKWGNITQLFLLEIRSAGCELRL